MKIITVIFYIIVVLLLFHIDAMVTDNHNHLIEDCVNATER